MATMARLGAGSALGPLVWRLLEGPARAAGGEARAPDTSGGGTAVPALHWRPAAGGAAQCDLCPRAETLASGETGFCRARQNVGGRLVALAFDRPCILNVDPVEKSPLAHVLPGTSVLSVAHAGCNLRCLYCQNWVFSQRGPAETRSIAGFTRAGAVEGAVRRGLRGVAFTYTEPGVGPEFVADLAAMARDQGLLPTLCTGGYLSAGPLRRLLAPFAAVTVTYKGATDAFYESVCGGRVKPVLDAMALVRGEGKWLEVATLLVPGRNDDAPSLRAMAAWIARSLGPATPWHLERFNPQFKLANLPPTPLATLEAARRIGLDAGLKFVYISNLAPHDANHTFCPRCGKAVIRRLGFKVLADDLRGGRCPHCREALPGVWA